MNVQHPIDLMPDSIRARALAGVRAGRMFTAMLLAVVSVVLVTTHYRLHVKSGREDLAVARAKADHALEVEADVRRLTSMFRSLHTSIDRYETIAMPVSVSEIIATLIEELPHDLSLDRLDLDSGLRKPRRGSAHGGIAEEDIPCILRGELAGFGSSDAEVAEFVRRIKRPPFRNVNFDYSGTRVVRGHRAREFRVSFEVDLSQRYEVNTLVVVPETNDLD